MDGKPVEIGQGIAAVTPPNESAAANDAKPSELALDQGALGAVEGDARQTLANETPSGERGEGSESRAK